MIQEAIAKIAQVGNPQNFTAFAAKVLAVDGSTCDVEPVQTGTKIFDVKIKASLNGTSGFYAKPKVGSFVIIVMIDKNNAFVALCSEAEEIYCVVDGEDNGGVVKIEGLMSRLNAIENAVQNAFTLIQTHVHPIPTGASGPSPTIAALPSVGTSNRANLENTKFKH